MSDFNKEDNQKYLQELYRSQGATTDVEKIELLSGLLEGKAFSFFACGGEVTDTIRVNVLEREYLIQEGRVTPHLV